MKAGRGVHADPAGAVGSIGRCASFDTTDPGSRRC